MITSLIPSLKLNKLNQLCLLIGALKLGKNKLDKCNQLFNQLDLLKTCEQRNINEIIAIDTGLINFAFSRVSFLHSSTSPFAFSHVSLHSSTSHLPSPPILLNWQKWNLNLKYLHHDNNNNNNTSISPQSLSNIVTHLTTFFNKSLSSSKRLIVIERQRLRTNSSKFITEPIINTNLLEYALFHSLSDSKDNIVISSDPGKMTKFWLTNSTNYNKSMDSKKLRVNLVKSMLQGNNHSLIDISNFPNLHNNNNNNNNNNKKKKYSIFDSLGLIEGPNGKRKDDDLVDSFLHNLSWFQYYQNYISLNDIVSITQLNDWIDYTFNQHVNNLNSFSILPPRDLV